jgi:hypothetical protein
MVISKRGRALAKATRAAGAVEVDSRGMPSASVWNVLRSCGGIREGQGRGKGGSRKGNTVTNGENTTIAV